MRSPAPPTLLPTLLAQIREAWAERTAVDLVHRLAADHEDLADDLYDYLDYLADLDLDDVSPDTRNRSAFAEAVRTWRDRNLPPSESPNPSDCGTSPPATPRPLSLVKLAKTRTGLRSREIERRTGLPCALLTKVGQYRRHLPRSWGREVERRFSTGLGIDAEETRASYEAGYSPVRDAASRSGEIDGRVPTPEGLLDMCGVSDPDERAFWLSLAEEDPDLPERP